MHQDAEEIEGSTEKFDVVGPKVFNFHSVQSKMIAKLKLKTNQRTHLCKYERNTGSIGKLMPTRKVQSAMSKHRDY